MIDRLQVRLSKSQQEQLEYFYKVYHSVSDSMQDQFTEALHEWYLEKTGQSESEEIVEEIPNCPQIPTIIKSSKNKGLVYCPNPKIAGLRKGNYLEIEACQNCWWRREEFRLLEELPSDETILAPDKDSEEAKPKKPTSKKKPKQSMNCKDPYCDRTLVRKPTKNQPITEFCGWHRHSILNYPIEESKYSLNQQFVLGLLRGNISPVRSSKAKNQADHMQGILDGTISAISSERRTCIDCGCDINHLDDWKTRCLKCHWESKEKQPKEE